MTRPKTPTTPPLFVTLTEDERADLTELARVRFAGNRSAVVRAALEIAGAVYATPEARAEAEPLAALAAYVRAVTHKEP